MLPSEERKKNTLLYSLSGPSIFEELRLMCNVGGHCILGREEAQTNRRNLIFNFFLVFLCCCCSVTQLCLSLCDPMDCSMQASLSFTITQSLLKLMSIELVMPSIHLILCRPLLLLPPIFPSIRVFSSVSALHIRWPKDWSFSFSISLSNEYSGFISFINPGLISLQSKGLSRVFSSTTVQKYQFFGAEPSLWSSAHIHTLGLEKPQLWPYRPLLAK